ncbi:hypothetical protein [Candidatus Pandoraea novymonadis]|uniref:hypothetical protein n=1 Tax=Candidatus Pandoraea novymonadis TaxID=1808959 RepID=UPI000D051784|nr:hypothetical protein [Candidatus Pandoraea novymonadis]
MLHPEKHFLQANTLHQISIPTEACTIKYAYVGASNSPLVYDFTPRVSGKITDEPTFETWVINITMSLICEIAHQKKMHSAKKIKIE